MLEIRDTPSNLRSAVTLVAKRQYRVIVGLSDGVAVALMIANALAVAFKDTGVGIGMRVFEPVEQGRSEIEPDACIAIDDSFDAAAIVSYAGECIGPVTLRVNPLVPVMAG